MYTLQEFLQFTKGWEYIIAVIAVFVFVPFWWLVAGKVKTEKHEKKKAS